MFGLCGFYVWILVVQEALGQIDAIYYMATMLLLWFVELYLHWGVWDRDKIVRLGSIVWIDELHILQSKHKYKYIYIL